MRTLFICLSALAIALSAAPALAEAPVSEATQECIDCHTTIHPGIVEGWKRSRHAQMTPAQARKAYELALKVSSTDIPGELQNTAVGCAECHTLRNDKHADTFDHNDVDIHIVVSPDDCATCHIQERQQYGKNLMAHAYRNLVDNALYRDLQKQISGVPKLAGNGLQFSEPAMATQEDSCLYCHGTKLAVTGTEVRDTDAGELEFPKISGWPNQGVGRVNLDGSLGSCSACHTRHTFSIEMARKPHTCRECHVGPDVPAYKVYAASKHGNMYSAKKADWDFTSVPWVVGEDFTAPTCAACHVSLLVNTDGDVVAERTHQMTNRLATRIFGLVYAHPQPASPQTHIIRNANGLPLPTTLDGKNADKFLIDKAEQERRTETMQEVCRSCHSQSWINGYWDKYRRVIAETNATVKIATEMVSNGWKQKIISGPATGDSPFDEPLERLWMDAWLFYANTVRFSSAMGGGGDYSTFADGRYQLNSTLVRMGKWYDQVKSPYDHPHGPGPHDRK